MNFFKTIAYVIKRIVLLLAAAGVVWYLLGHVKDRNPVDGGLFVEQGIERMVSL